MIKRIRIFPTLGTFNSWSVTFHHMINLKNVLNNEYRNLFYYNLLSFNIFHLLTFHFYAVLKNYLITIILYMLNA